MKLFCNNSSFECVIFNELRFINKIDLKNRRRFCKINHKRNLYIGDKMIYEGEKRESYHR